MAKRDAQWVGTATAKDASTYVLTPRHAPYLVSINDQFVLIKVDGSGSPAGTPPAPVKQQKVIAVKPKAIRPALRR